MALNNHTITNNNLDAVIVPKPIYNLNKLCSTHFIITQEGYASCIRQCQFNSSWHWFQFQQHRQTITKGIILTQVISFVKKRYEYITK